MESFPQKAKEDLHVIVENPKGIELLLEQIKTLSPHERARMLTVLEAVGQELETTNNTAETRIRSGVWHGVVEILAMGLGFHAQALLHQTTGPDARHEVIQGRIDSVRKALAAE